MLGQFFFERRCKRSQALMFPCRLPSPRSKLGLYLDNAKKPGKKVHISFYRPQAVPVFGGNRLQICRNKGLNPLFFAFDWIYTFARRDRDLSG